MLFHEFLKASEYEYPVPPHETETTIPLDNAIIAVTKYAADAGADLASYQVGTRLLKNYDPGNQDSISSTIEAVAYFEDNADVMEQREIKGGEKINVVLHHRVQEEIDSCKAAIEIAGKCMEALCLLAENIDGGLPFHSAARGFPPDGHLLLFDNDRTIDAAFLKAHNVPDCYIQETPPRSNVLFQFIAQADTLKNLIKEKAAGRALAPA